MDNDCSWSLNSEPGQSNGNPIKQHNKRQKEAISPFILSTFLMLLAAVISGPENLFTNVDASKNISAFSLDFRITPQKLI